MGDVVSYAVLTVWALPFFLLYAVMPAVPITYYFQERAPKDKRWLFVPVVSVAVIAWVGFGVWFMFYFNSNTPPL